MFRVLLLIVTGAAPSAAQIAVSPQRIAGLSPANWSIGDGGPAVDALLGPSALAWDRAGNLLIADTRNQRIRRMTPDGAISTLLNQDGVVSMAVDSKGNLYVSVFPNSYTDRVHIFEFSPGGFSPVGSKAEIPNPGSSGIAPAIAIDAADNLYITDQPAGAGGFVWKRSPSGSVQKIAGKVGPGGLPSQGGPALEVTLAGPHALAFDRSGSLLIGDFYGVLRLNPDGTLVRLFGLNSDGTLVRLFGQSLQRIAPAADGSIYFIGDYYGIARWSAADGVTSFAGTQQSGFSDGCALSGGKRIAKYATFDPSDLVFDTGGRLYVADNGGFDFSDPGRFYSSTAGRIRRIDPDGSIRTVAGTGSMPHESASGGPAIGAIYHNPEALAVDGAGNVFFAESSANHVHEITAAGQFLTVAGADSPPAGEDSACYPMGKDVLSSPMGVALDADGNLYISDTGRHRILRRSANGAMTTIAGTGVAGQAGDGGPAVQAQISRPTAIAVKPDGSIYFVTDRKLRRIGSDGVIESPAAPEGIYTLVVGFDGRLILSGFKLYKEAASGIFQPLRSSAAGMLATDSAGATYSPANPLVRISQNCNVAAVTFTQGLISQSLQGLTNDRVGNLYLSANNSVWRIAPITPPATDAPSVYMDNLGVFNAASNLIALANYPSPCFKNCTYSVNDSVTGNEILRITGGCMGPLEPSQSSLDGGRLPTSLQGTRVLFDGEAAPLLSVQATEIFAISPQDVASKSKVTIAVESQGGVPASAVLIAAAAAPGIFVLSGRQALAVNEDGSLNGTDHPAPVGSVVSLFLTGAGLTNPPIADGMLPDLPLPLALPVTVQVGGAAAEVVYAGALLGWPGEAQVNIRVPAVAASDAVPVRITIGGNSRNQGVTIAVQ